MNHKLDDLTLVNCPALRTAVTSGMCRKICKFYEVSWRDGLEHCEYPKDWPIPLVESAAKEQMLRKVPKKPKKVHEIVSII
jgi:hypothetical protein